MFYLLFPTFCKVCFQIRKYQGKLTQPELDALQRKGQLLNNEVENIRAQIKKAGAGGLRGM